MTGRGQTPPWVLVVLLPDDCPPVAVDLSSLPRGSTVTAFCSEAAERVLDIAGQEVAADHASEPQP